MRLPMLPPSQSRILSFIDKDMPSSSAYSLQLPYLGSIPLGKAPPNLVSLQKPLRELYIPYYRQRRERFHDERRIIISERDILIFEPDAALKGKRSLIYSDLESIVDAQALEFYVMFNHTENHQQKRIRAAFLPIGCENQERFRSLYSTIDKSQYQLLSTALSPVTCHPPLVLLVMRKPGAGGSCSLLDCHLFATGRESSAFEFCDMMRKLILKRTMSPGLPNSTKTTTLLRIHENNNNEVTPRIKTKYLDRDRPISAMEHRQADIPSNGKNSRSVSIGFSNDVHSTSNGSFANPSLLSTSMLRLNNEQHCQPYHDTSQVLTNGNGDIHSFPSPPPRSTPIRTLSIQRHSQQRDVEQRHFIKASSTSKLINGTVDESDEVVNDLMSIVVAEKLKSFDSATSLPQVSIKRHASFDQSSSSNGHNGYTMSKKRFHFNHHHHHQQQQQQQQNHKKRSLIINSIPLPTILSATSTPTISRTTTNLEQSPSTFSNSILDSHLLRPQLVLNRYGDIGNYVPKLLRENTSSSLRSSDSNENIFFRASNGHLINGFLKLDFPSSPTTTTNGNNENENIHYRSSPCLTNPDNHDQSVVTLIRQLRKYQTKSYIHTNDDQRDADVPTIDIDNGTIDDDHPLPSCRIPRVILHSPPKSMAAAMGGVKVLPAAPLSQSSQRPSSKQSSSLLLSSKPRRVASFTMADTELPIDYRQYLRHTDQGVQLYGEEQQRQLQQQPSSLEHTLGYLP